MSKAFMIADCSLLIGAPIIFAGLLLAGTLTPGNSPVGLAIGWAADAAWLGIGIYAAWKRYWRK